MEQKYYLKTSHACDLYSIEVTPFRKNSEKENYVIFSEKEKNKYEKLVEEVRTLMQKKWDLYQKEFEENKKYWYLTTRYSSHIRKLALIKEPSTIKEKISTETCTYNYFTDKTHAQNLLKEMLILFKAYNVEMF